MTAGDLRLAAEAAADCLGIDEGDRVLVLYNEPKRSIAEALAAASGARTRRVRLLEFPALSRNGEEPPGPVARAMLDASVVLAPTVYSISHTQARLAATARGARIAGMSSLTAASFAEALATDYPLLRSSGERVAAALTASSSCRITSPAGTELVLSVDRRQAIVDDGQLQQPGAFGNLPAGEAYIAPIETVGDGTIVFDGVLAGHGLLRTPLRVRLESGRAVAAEGEAAAWLLSTLDAGGHHGRSIAELGIGTNPAARLSGLIAIDEKALGTAHLAFGTNASFGGANQSNVHIDGVLLQPTVELDGQALLEAGVLAATT
jgi:leucyl aminopeptidase (aminopeptidase T)